MTRSTRTNNEDLISSDEDYDSQQSNPVSSSSPRGATARKTIRKQQNRDSARRCRQRRKMQTAEIFDLLREQRSLILKLERKVTEMSNQLTSGSRGGGGGGGKKSGVVVRRQPPQMQQGGGGGQSGANVSLNMVANALDDVLGSQQQGQGQGGEMFDVNVGNGILFGEKGGENKGKFDGNQDVLQFDGLHLPDLGLYSGSSDPDESF